MTSPDDIQAREAIPADGYRSIYEAVLACPHVIEHETITLKYDPKQGGRNALSQMASRIRLALAVQVEAALQSERSSREAEIEALRSKRHVDDINDLVLMGLARDEAIARATAAEAEAAELRKALEDWLAAEDSWEDEPGDDDRVGFAKGRARATLSRTASKEPSHDAG